MTKQRNGIFTRRFKTKDAARAYRNNYCRVNKWDERVLKIIFVDGYWQIDIRSRFRIA